MPPARVRALDDSRSEASSTIFTAKEKNSLGAMGGAGVSKQKKNPGPASNSIPKNTTTAAVSGAAASADPNLLRIDWVSVPPALLQTYRTAYRLPTPSSYSLPHADLTYRSSKTALRAPSAISARRKLRDLKHQRRKAAIATATTCLKGKSKDKDKDTDTSSNSDRLLKPLSTANNRGASDAADVATSPDPSFTTDPPMHPPTAPEYIGKQSPASLATAVRKHFNAQQLNEADLVARFIYVAKQTRNSRATVRTEGSNGDGEGWSIGSQGREIRKGEGGEVGFRLRFRP